MRLKLPHIPRLFTATILPGVANFSLWALLVGILSLNLWLTKTKPPAYLDKLMNVFSQPLSAASHERLALALWDSGAHADAKQELRLATELEPGTPSDASLQVLGVSTTPSDLLQTWEGVPSREAAQLAYWQKVAAAHPDYRDALIQLAAISYAQGNLVQAKTYLGEASVLDPNGIVVNNLFGFLDKLLK